MTAPIPKDIRATVIADCLSGMAQIEAARKNGISGASVYRILRDAGVVLHKKADTKAQLDAACADYIESGHSSKVAAKRHGISDDALRAELTRRGQMRKRGGARSFRVRRDAIEDYLTGMSIAKVSAKHGIARSTISSWLDQAGLGMEDRDGESPYVYDGGWMLIGGVRRPVKPTRKKVA